MKIPYLLSLLIVPTFFGLFFSEQVSAADPADLRKLLDTGVCNGCNLREVNLTGLKLAGAKLRWSDLRGANFTKIDLDRADLTGADLSGATMSESSFRASVLEGANLYGVALYEMRLAGSDLRWSNLSHLDVDLDLEFVDLVGVLLEGSRFKNNMRCARLPEKGGWGCAANHPSTAH